MAPASMPVRFAVHKRQPPQVAAFSVLELIVVLIILGVLAASVLPRWPKSSDVAARAGRDDLLATLRYGQQLAMSDATRTFRVETSATSFSLTVDGTALAQPDGRGNYPQPLPDGATLAPAITLTYNGLGETTATVFTITAGDSWQVCVEASGYAHAC